MFTKQLNIAKIHSCVQDAHMLGILYIKNEYILEL